MKAQIRKSVFETNSSSTHALCIGKNIDKKEEIVNFGILLHDEYRNSDIKKYFQYKADTLFSAIISPYTCDKETAFYRLGRLIELLTAANIKYSFNFSRDYIHNCPYMDTDDWVDTVLESAENLMKYLFSDDSEYIEIDRDDLYRLGGWNNIINKNKCDVYV